MEVGLEGLTYKARTPKSQILFQIPATDTLAKINKQKKQTTFNFDAVISGDSSYSPNVLGRPIT